MNSYLNDIGSGVMAHFTSAIVDRLTYKAILVDMEGDSYRLRETLKENGEIFEYIKKAKSKKVG